MLAIYPGSFDPLHKGHLDVIERARKLFDEVLVAVFVNASKQAIFDAPERVRLVRESTRHLTGVRVEPGQGLLVDFARRHGAGVIIRGLRAVLDFDYELQLALMNKKLAPDLETVFMLTDENLSYLSSTLIKELASYHRDVSLWVPPAVNEALIRHYREK